MVSIRPARLEDVPAIGALIPTSVRALSRGIYTDQQIESALRHLFGVDTQLILDGTYLLAEDDEGLAGCGGWSRRRTLYGGDQSKTGADAELDPARDAAGIRRLELMATLPGIPLYERYGFEPAESVVTRLADGTEMPSVRMIREVTGDR